MWRRISRPLKPRYTCRNSATQNDFENSPGTDGFEQAELPTEIRRDEFNALFLAMEKTEAANAKNARVRRGAVKTADSKAVKPISERSRMRKERKGITEETVLTPDKVIVVTTIDTPIEAKSTKPLSDTSGPALIEAAENLIQQAQELIKAATKLIKVAGKVK